MCLEGPKGRLISFAVACPFALVITALPLQAGDTGIAGAQSVMQPGGLVGKATYVAERYNGRRTSSGEIYDSRKLTAAHPTIPHGTRVKVLNLANNRSVVVTVNDRCRKRRSEVIDLSREAARELGFLRKGTAKVRIIPINE